MKTLQIENMSDVDCDVAVIGAGPSGTVAAALLSQANLKVTVLEAKRFPRFSIGESLLPACMSTLEKAGMLPFIEDAALKHAFQVKNGAAFRWGDSHSVFDFEEKFTEGPHLTYQVPRDVFDEVLAEGAKAAGARILFERKVVSLRMEEHAQFIDYIDPDGSQKTLRSRFLLDASGFGRVLPRLLDLETASPMKTRDSIFTHIKIAPESGSIDPTKTLITMHPLLRDVWFWLIPFADGRVSLGVVGTPSQLSKGDTDSDTLWGMIDETPTLKQLLHGANVLRPIQRIRGYSASVRTLHGPGFALLGNAGEFLDPIYSSGVLIAVESAERAAILIIKELKGGQVDWDAEFEGPLREGIDTMKSMVDAWYDGSFQDIIFNGKQMPHLRRMFSSILAGYVWDKKNPYVTKTKRRVRSLAALIQKEAAKTQLETSTP